jgi:SAM-dependent methyltransferase
MTSEKLGLPAEYQIIPEFFDGHSESENTKIRNAILEKFLKKHGIKTVLDLTCGTGSQVFYLAQRNYKIIGSDFSEPLLKIARKKAQQNKIKTKFISGDMRHSRLGKFDAVITMFNAIGHLSRKDFAKTLKNVGKNLHPGGIYVFDIFNLEAMSRQVVQGLAMDQHYKIGQKNVRQIQRSTFNQRRGILTSYDRYFITENNKTKKFSNKFSLQIYSAKQLKKMLEQNGFKVLDMLDFKDSKPLRKNSQDILTIAQKI